MPKRERYLWVCTNRRPDGHPKGSCGEQGSADLQLALKAAVAEAGLHRSLRVMHGGCQDLCWVGATAAVMPDNVFLKNLEQGDIPALIEALRSEANVGESAALRAAGKVALPNDFDEATATKRAKAG